MKKILLASVLVLGMSSPSYAWWDSYGGFTCGYLDPLTSILDNIFGPPCPPPQPVLVEQPVAVAVPVAPPPPPQPAPYVVPGPIYDCPMRAVPYPFSPTGFQYVPNC
jgi:hypothetical protein